MGSRSEYKKNVDCIIFTDAVDISPVYFYPVRTCYQTVNIDFFDLIIILR